MWGRTSSSWGRTGRPWIPSKAQEMMDEGTSQPCELVASLLSREQFQIFKEVVPANIQS